MLDELAVDNLGLIAAAHLEPGPGLIALTGESGGRLASLADVAIRVPARRTDRIQELHLRCYHALCEMLEAEFFQGREK